MNNYLEGLILQALDKAKRLMDKCKPAELDGRFQQLASITNNKLTQLIQDIYDLLTNKKYQKNNTHNSERFKGYQSICRELDRYENVALAVLSRSKEDDTYMTLLAHKVCQQINYPLPAPVVSCLSQDYYCMYQEVNLICVPLLESYYLLHLPDFFHELGHPLHQAHFHPTIKKYQESWVTFNNEVRIHFSSAKKELYGSNSTELVQFFEAWQKNWLNSKGVSNWSIELFCDLFAVYTCGPAYAWAHLYLTTKKGDDPYRLPMFSIEVHPNAAARMQVILAGLETLGFLKVKEEISRKWHEYLTVSGSKKQAYQKNAYPTSLLNKCASYAYKGINAAEFKPYSDEIDNGITVDLNEAWKSFWSSPSTYSEWEKDKVKSIKMELGRVV